MIARFALVALVGTLFLAPAGALPQDDPIETRVYNVELLTNEIPDWPGAGTPGLDIEMGNRAAVANGGRSFLNGEDIRDLIRSNIGEDSWSNDWALAEYANGALTVTNRKSVLDQIGGYIAYLKGLYGRMVVVDATLVSIDPELLSEVRSKSATTPGLLSPEQVRQILDQKDKANVVRSMRVTAYSGQRVCADELERRQYVKDCNIQSSAAVAALFPVIGEFSIGAAVDVRPIIEVFGGAVSLDVRGALADLKALEDEVLNLNKTGAKQITDRKSVV
jgi:hypothetical protein